MICPKCGAENNDDRLFCGECGERLSGGGSSAEPNTDKSPKDINEFDDTIIMKPVSASKSSAQEKSYKRKFSEADAAEKRAREAKAESARGPAERRDAGKSTENNGMRTAVIVLSCCLTLMIIVASAFALKLASESGEDVKKITDKVEDTNIEADETEEEDGEADEAETDDESEAQTEEAAAYSTIPVDMVYATTERTEGDEVYSAENAVDSKLSTAWSPELDTGAGESLTLCFSTSRTVHGIKIANGFSKTEADYLKNARVKNITVKFPDGSALSYELNDNTVSLQSVDFGREFACQSLSVCVDSVYPGEDSQMIFVSEIEVY